MNLWLAKNNCVVLFVSGRSAYTFRVDDSDNTLEKYSKDQGSLARWRDERIEKYKAVPLLIDGKHYDIAKPNFQIMDYGVEHQVAVLHMVPHPSMLTYQAVVDGKSAAVQFFVRVSKKQGRERITTHVRIRQLNEEGDLSFLILEH